MYTQTAVVMLGYRTAYDGHAASLWILDSDHHGRAQPAGPDTVVQDGGAWRQCGESGVRRTRFLRDERILVASLLASLPSSHKISIVLPPEGRIARICWADWAHGPYLSVLKEPNYTLLSRSRPHHASGNFASCATRCEAVWPTPPSLRRIRTSLWHLVYAALPVPRLTPQLDPRPDGRPRRVYPETTDTRQSLPRSQIYPGATAEPVSEEAMSPAVAKDRMDGLDAEGQVGRSGREGAETNG
jgi:hypothetical protein